MGGSVFSNVSDVHTPRMSSDAYIEVKTRSTAILKSLYEVVTVPHEAPGKTSFGDVDFVVATPVARFDSLQDTLKVAFSTPYAVKRSLDSWSVAMRYDEEGYARVETSRAPLTIDNGFVAEPSSYNNGTTYAQVDIHVCDSVHELEWVVFKTSYSDLWQILNTLIRPGGLVCDHEGLKTRIKEVEDSSMGKRASQILLTCDRNEILDFLRLDRNKYDQGFRTQDEVFGWIVDSPLVHGCIVSFRHAGSDADKGLKMLKNDHARYSKRPMFREFVDEFLPRPIIRERQGPPISRETLMHEALDKFNGWDQYHRIMKDFKKAEREQSLQKQLAENLDEKVCSLVIRGLKNCVRCDDNGQLVVREPASLGHDSQDTYAWTLQDDEALPWILKHVEKILQAELDRRKSMALSVPK